MDNGRNNPDLMIPDRLGAFILFHMEKMNQEEVESFVNSIEKWLEWRGIDDFFFFISHIICHDTMQNFTNIDLIANSLRNFSRFNKEPAILIHIFDLDMVKALNLINAYESRIKENKWHPRRAKESLHRKLFKDTGEIDAFEFKNPPDPFASINSRRHVPFKPYNQNG